MSAPVKAKQDAASRLRNAATGVADAHIRFGREFERLQRALGDARRAGHTERQVAELVRSAAKGSPDRAKALIAINESLNRIHEGELPDA